MMAVTTRILAAMAVAAEVEAEEVVEAMKMATMEMAEEEEEGWPIWIWSFDVYWTQEQAAEIFPS